MNQFLQVQPEIREALATQTPVVALESTIISHGMPYPQNVETAWAVEQTVRENGAIPATIAIINGKCRVGLSAQELETFGKEKNVWKVSLRDMPIVVSKKMLGATTVAATMRIATMAGIKIFATGGTGGVHRGAETSMDVSADLTEMEHTSVAIVSAGVKSILDIGLTLEYLETKGIPVVTIGQNEFPSFYSRKSGFNSPLRLDTATEIADMLKTKWSLGLQGSVLIANPIPDAYEIPAATMETHILQALDAAQKNNVKGKEVTPFLLQYIAEHTKGESLEANIALIKHNAKRGAEIALALAG
ncbi:MAG TPA: pseudouridine-5'-phosphate glycosidase [Chitinophagaceae bacterium]|jgi:pseudouridine-5'-phosphate glycosidase|nr:pseudouridine-5'-phosphate glycosidase [Chitinophagaceae bacterium]HNA97668.1 pseudouridine-5'-phosphate glycosidase [Chitinophagaceae bacterium]HNC38143.1 pseudouridine-5'-phosphate glycosidase [Chitinophagaceae bacterium]HND94798.1 pseudouridine-5'-phosphate glycosidase [Chitinophagaceae bacterium]HNF47511.1 pseudouridine-5'-phosphate glycosidase [Chitinophagaceae bacterium]